MSEPTADWVIAGKPDGTVPTVGKIYEVRHSRKGTFRLKVKQINGIWLTGEITGGTVAKAMMTYNVKTDGEEITIRDEHSYLIEV